MLLSELEKTHIIAVLSETKNNKNVAAKTLGIGRATLYRKMKAYGIEGIKVRAIKVG